MIDSGGGTGDVEVLAYVNSNLIVIHENNQAQELAKSSSTSSSTAIPINPPLVPSLNQEIHVKISEETQTRKIINSETTGKWYSKSTFIEFDEKSWIFTSKIGF